MTYSRYSKRRIFINKDKNYKNVFFKNRDIQEMVQYDSPRISFPTPEEALGLKNTVITWQATDKLYNLSQQFYGSPAYWWVIAWYNRKASEAEFSVGDTVYIPQPLEDVLGYIE